MLSESTVEKAVSMLGYELTERLGSGGYGEVWGAIAPGGLPKAVKILYGLSGERRAQTELKSLQKIKQIRHPFLLSLERIDVVENQVIIVTELADRSLADVFEDCVQRGLPGIPRTDLIAYMRQAAEVLDYLYSEHSLQHLDVKPENLMLVGKHIKLGDFGLIKDLRDCSQSMLSGLTPTYSAPELFDGTPSLTSDQYSLAIVYQEMLTGTRPFSGVTPAQLASQHLHEPPDVSPLPKADQPVVSKALSKSSERRFRTCVEFIDQLNHSELLTKKRNRVNILARCMSETIQKSASQASHAAKRLTSQTTRKSIHAPAPSAIEWVSADKSPPPASEFTPVMFVGVGNSGAHILRFLKTKLQRQYGSMSALPGISFLALDSDIATVNECSFESNGLVPLLSQELLHMALKKPEFYRSRSQIHSHWLHRRWIFNVPKSLQTEGLRPLGRLAFADHFESICMRMMAQFETVAAPESLQETADTLGLRAGQSQPKIVLVGAVSGGLGSGLMLDLSYLAKAMLAELNFEREGVHGILLNARKHPNRNGELSVANTIAFLTELRHFTQCGYPGDCGIGIPEMHDACPMDLAYLVDLGTDQSEGQWQEHLESVADYLYLSTCSPAESFFHQHRESTPERDYFALRSFGLHYVNRLEHASLAQLADYACEQLLKNWFHGKEPNQVDASFLQTMETYWQVEHWNRAVESQVLQANAFEEFRAQLEVHLNPSQGSDEQLSELLGDLFSSLFENVGTSGDGRDLTKELNAAMDEFVALQAQTVASNLAQWVESSLDSKQFCLAQVLNTLRTLQGHFERAAAQQRAHIGRLNAQVAHLNSPQTLMQSPFRTGKKRIAWEEVRHFVIETKKQLTTTLLSARMLKKLSSIVDETRENLFVIQNQIQHAFANHQVGPATPIEPLPGDQPYAWLTNATVSRMLAEIPEIVDGCDARIFEQIVKPLGGYLRLLRDFDDRSRGFVESVQAVIYQELLRAASQLDYDQIINTHSHAMSLLEYVADVGKDCLPQIRTNKAKAHLLIAGPSAGPIEKTARDLTSAMPTTPQSVAATHGSLIVAAEADDVQLADVVFELIQQHPNTFDMSRRVLSRNDIDWLPLENLL